MDNCCKIVPFSVVLVFRSKYAIEIFQLLRPVSFAQICMDTGQIDKYTNWPIRDK